MAGDQYCHEKNMKKLTSVKEWGIIDIIPFYANNHRRERDKA